MHRSISRFAAAFAPMHGLCLLLFLQILLMGSAQAQGKQAVRDLAESIEHVQSAIVGIGLITPLESSSAQLLGTGFVVADGNYVVTNYHVVSKPLDPSIVQHYVAFVGQGPSPQLVKLSILVFDPVNDLAILELQKPLPALTLAPDKMSPPGTSIFFTGFPLGAVLGLYPATHTGIVSAITPDATPARNADELTTKMLSRLQTPFLIYQLDATAYPGNSGSPVFDQRTLEVVGVLNKVFVSEGKESALSQPSGISYAVPIKQLRKLAKRANIQL